MLKLFGTELGVAAGKGLLFNHLLHFFLKRLKSKSLLSHDVFLQVADSLADPGLNQGIVILRNFDAILDFLEQLLNRWVVALLKGSSDALAAEFQELRIGVFSVVRVHKVL